MSQHKSKSDLFHILGILYSEGENGSYAQVSTQFILAELGKDGIERDESILLELRNQGLIRLHDDWAQLTEAGETELYRLQAMIHRRGAIRWANGQKITLWINPSVNMFRMIWEIIKGHH